MEAVDSLALSLEAFNDQNVKGTTMTVCTILILGSGELSHESDECWCLTSISHLEIGKSGDSTVKSLAFKSQRVFVRTDVHI